MEKWPFLIAMVSKHFCSDYYSTGVKSINGLVFMTSWWGQAKKIGVGRSALAVGQIKLKEGQTTTSSRPPRFLCLSLFHYYFVGSTAFSFFYYSVYPTNNTILYYFVEKESEREGDDSHFTKSRIISVIFWKMPGGVISSATKVYYAHFFGKMIYNDKQEIIAVDEMCLFLSCYCTQVFFS